MDWATGASCQSHRHREAPEVNSGSPRWERWDWGVQRQAVRSGLVPHASLVEDFDVHLGGCRCTGHSVVVDFLCWPGSVII